MANSSETHAATSASTDTVPAAAPSDIAPLGALRKIRKIEERFSRVDPRLEVGIGAISGFASEVRCGLLRAGASLRPPKASKTPP
jgi:hypothetical protein